MICVNISGLEDFVFIYVSCKKQILKVIDNYFDFFGLENSFRE
jgi:hypothetical protein